ncbi:MAG: choice-of-anchor D domain-containing protein [Chitinispirillaceae bacterium]|nr:choice-of-anchor D domain-containing protein [Chitinispirillaceae bacterium]
MNKYILKLLSAGIAIMVCGTVSLHAQNPHGNSHRAAALPLKKDTEPVMVQVTSPAGAASINLTYTLPEAGVKPTGSRLGTTELYEVAVGNAFQKGNEGEPVLPVIPVQVVIPAGYSFDKAVVLDSKRKQIKGTHRIRHGQANVPLIPGARQRIAQPEASIYGSDNAYPSSVIELVGIQYKKGVPIAFLQLHPVSYQPKSGKISVCTSISFELQLKKESTRKHLKPRPKDLNAATLQVENPEAIETYKQESVAPLDESVSPLGICDPAQSFRYVVVTPDSFATATTDYTIRDLVAQKQSRGFTTTIVTIETVLANYTGVDNAERLRNFIIDAYANWETEYILLGGDINVIPMRKLYCNAAGEVDQIPSDLYYQCLDGNYNSDNDSYWGETTDGPGGTDVDLMAEVYIGRASAENKNEMSNFVYKTLAYENSPENSAYLRRALMVGEYLGFGGVSEYATATMEEIRLGSSSSGYTTAGFASSQLFSVDTLYDRSGYEWPASEILSRMSSGTYGIYNHLGHANYNYVMKFYNASADALTNDNFFFAYSQGCIPGNFEADCIAEHLTTSNRHGAYAVVFNSRYGWGQYNSTDGPSQRFDRQFWDAYFGEFMTNLGALNADSHEDNIWDINGDCIRWCYYETNLFGDPQTPVRGRVVGPSLAYSSHTLSDNNGGNGDGLINPGESIDITLTAANVGTESATGVTATISESDQYVTVTTGTTSFGAIQCCGATSTAQTPIRLSIASGCPTPRTVTLSCLLRDSRDSTWNSTFTITVYTSSQVSGFVRAVTGSNPIAGATVSFSGPVSGSVTTNASGAYMFGGIDGTYRVVASASNYLASDTQEVTVPPGQQNVNFALKQLPQIAVSPRSINKALFVGDSVSDRIVIKNTVAAGNGNLQFSIDITNGVLNTSKGSPSLIYPENARNSTTDEVSVTGSNRLLKALKPSALPGKTFTSSNLKILCAAALSDTTQISSFVEGLRSLSNVSLVTPLNCNSSIPNLAYLQDYDIVVAISNSYWSDYELMGNTLADYVDAGGKVCILNASFCANGNWSLSGRIMTSDYSPFIVSEYTTSSATSASFESHLITNGVQTITTSLYSYNSTLQGRSISLGKYSNGYHLAAYNPDKPIVAINVFPIESYWGGDLVLMMGNSFDFLSGPQWLTISPKNGSVAPGDSAIITVKFNAKNMLGGSYPSNLSIDHNASNEATPLLVPCTLTVDGMRRLSARPASINFGNLWVGARDTVSLWLINSGDEATAVSSISSGNTNFSVPGSLPLTVPALDSIEVLVIFQPGTLGNHSGTLAINSNAEDNPSINVSCTGTGTSAPGVEITPVSISRMMPAGMSDTSLLTIENTGGAPLTYTITTVPTDGNSSISSLRKSKIRRISSDSTIENGLLLPSDFVKPNNAGLALVNYPFFDGFENGNWNNWTPGSGSYTRLVTSATAASGTYSFTLNGSNNTHYDGVSAQFATAQTPEDISFSVRVNDNTSACGYFVLGPTSSCPIFFFMRRGEFYANEYTAVYYQPNTWYNVRFHIDWVSRNFDLYIDGELAVSDIPFRDQVNSFTTFYLYNYDNSQAWYDNINIGNAPEAEWLTLSPVSGTVAAGASAEIQTILNSANMLGGKNTRNIQISTNAPGHETLVVPCTLNVDGFRRLTASPSSHNFGPVWVGLRDTLALRLINAGNEATQVNSITSNNAVFTISGSLPVTVPAFDSVTVAVIYEPTTIEVHNGTIVVLSDAEDNPSISLSCSGSGTTPPVASVNPDSLYYNLLPSDPASTRVCYVKNTGGDALNYHIQGINQLSNPVGSSTSSKGILPKLRNDLIYSPDNLDKEFINGRVIIGTAEGSSSPQLSSLDKVGYRTIRELGIARNPRTGLKVASSRKAFLVTLADTTKEGVLKAVEMLKNEPSIAYVEPDYVVKAIATPNDSYFSQLYAMFNNGQTGGTVDADIDATDVWDRHTGNRSILIGIIDTGIDYVHPDLAANIWTNPGEIANNGIDDDNNGYTDDIHGWDFAYDDSNPTDGHYHGTHCAGTIAGVGNNGIGVAGVMWTASLVALKFLDDGGSGSTSDAIDAVNYANAMDIKITSNSWGGGGFSQGLMDAIAVGGLFVAAAGNSGSDNDASPHYPSSYALDNIVAVAATDDDDLLANFSCYGLTSVDLGAPGVDIYSCAPGSGYQNLSGTSMATPHVSGAAGLIWTYNPFLSASQVKELLMDNVDPVSALNGRCVTGGRLNVDKALRAAGPTWLTASPMAGGIVAPGDSAAVSVTVTPTGLFGGRYEGEVMIGTDDPVHQQLRVAVATDIEGFRSLTITPTSVNFGAIWAGARDTIQIRLSNSGNETTIVNSVSSSNPLFVAAGTFPLTIAPSGSVQIPVIYQPVNIGNHSGIITFNSNAEDNPSINVSCTGTGTNPPSITVTPQSISSRVIAGDSATHTVTISNSGGANLHFEISTQESGTNPFAPKNVLIIGDGGTEVRLDSLFKSAGYTTTIVSDDGVYNGTNPVPDAFGVIVLTDGTNYGSDMPLAGQNAIVNFVQNGGGLITTEWIGFEIENGRYTALQSIVPFTRTSGSSGNETYTVISQHPITEGVDATFSITTGTSVGIANAGEIIVNGSVSGAAVVAASFGKGKVVSFASAGKYSSYDAFINENLKKLIVNALNWTCGSSTEWISLSRDTGTVQPGSSIQLQVTLRSLELAAGSYAGTINIEHNAPASNSPVVVPCTLSIGGFRGLTATPSTLTFKTVLTGLTDTLQLTLSNSGNETTVVSSMVSSNVAFSFIGSTPISVAPASSIEIPVVFYPLSAGNFNGILTINSNAEDNPVINVALAGTSLAGPSIAVTPPQMDVSLTTGDSTQRTATITNTGDADLIWNIAKQSTWLTATPLSGTTQSGQVSPIQFTFNATGLTDGLYYDTISVSHNSLTQISPLKIPVELHVEASVPGISGFITSIGISALPVTSGTRYQIVDLRAGSALAGRVQGNRYVAILQ